MQATSLENSTGEDASSNQVTIAQQEIELSPSLTSERSRMALGDVSNCEGGRQCHRATEEGTNVHFCGEKIPIQRSRRLSNADDDSQGHGNSVQEQEATYSRFRSAQNPVSLEKRDPSPRLRHHDVPSSDNIQEAKNTNEIRNKQKNRSKKRAKRGPFDIEELLLEPMPRKKRLKGTSKNSKQSQNVAMIDSDVTRSLQQSTDLFHTSDSDHCLLRKVEGPFDASKFTTGIATYDKANERVVHEVPVYVTDIFQRLFHAEKLNTPSSSYMSDGQPEINSTMRAILIDWLVVVHRRFRLKPETLYLCVNIIDRYLSRASVLRRRLQLLGITALFIASKYEEQYPPEVKDCVYITDRAYTRQDVLDMEFEVVLALEFKMTVPTAYPFLNRFLHITDAPIVVRHLASFYTERMLQEYCMLAFRPSLVASAAVCLAWSHPKVKEVLDDEFSQERDMSKAMETILNYTGYCEREIRHTGNVICFKIQPGKKVDHRAPPRKQLTGVNSKYRSERFSSVSDFPPPDASQFDPSG